MLSNDSRIRPLGPSARHLLRRQASPLPLSGPTMLRVVERNGARWTFFDARDVPRIRAEAKHTYFCLPADPAREWWLNESLESLGERLKEVGFVRVHRKELVNLRYLKAIERMRKGPERSVVIELRDGQRVPVSRRQTSALRRALSLLIAGPSPGAHSGAA